MNRFVILRVPVEMQTRGEPLRRKNFARATMVEECSSSLATQARVGELQCGVKLWHYYGAEIIYEGDPELKLPRSVKKVAPKQHKSVAVALPLSVTPIEEGRKIKEARE
jgi:hypothetical protein